MPQKVGIVGVGGVGTFFGLRLAEAGHDVRFLLRSDQGSPSSLRLESWQGDFELATPDCRSELGSDLDWVLVCLKSTALADDGAILDSTVAKAMGPSTRVQLLMNGLGAEEQAARRFGPERVHGGLVYGGFTRSSNTVLHEGVGAEIRGGSFVDDPSEIQAAAALWAETKVDYVPQPCLLRAQWAKLAWNIPFNGLTVAAGGLTVSDVWRTTNKHVAVDLMREVCQAANADLAANGKLDDCLDEQATIDALSAITDRMAAAQYVPSTTLDFNHKRPMEVDSIFAEPLRRAQASGLYVPRLSLLTNLLELLNEPLLAAADSS